jgi:hypothetical protein
VRLELLIHRVDQIQLSNLHERDLSHPRSATRQPQWAHLEAVVQIEDLSAQVPLRAHLALVLLPHAVL